MLQYRVITALLLIPLVVWGVFSLSKIQFAIGWGLIILAAAWEWSNLAGLKTLLQRLLFFVLILLSLLLAWYWPSLLWEAAHSLDWPDVMVLTRVLDWLVWPAVAWWFFIAMLLRSAPEKLLNIQFSVGLKVITAWFVLVSAWVLLTRLHVNFFEPRTVLYLLFLIWIADASAYFIGKKWGKTKLCPYISPGKTQEGMYGALFCAAVFALSIGLYYQMNPLLMADFVLLSVITVIISICGDLFVSLAKRKRGVKDSGALLPGHGGVLDRIDSLLAAAPVFYAGLLIRELFL